MCVVVCLPIICVCATSYLSMYRLLAEPRSNPSHSFAKQMSWDRLEATAWLASAASSRSNEDQAAESDERRKAVLMQAGTGDSEVSCVVRVRHFDSGVPGGGEAGVGGGGGGVPIDHRPSYLYNAGMEHVGFSPTRRTSRAPSAKRREIIGEWHEG